MKQQWTHDELAEHWTLLPDELKLLANKTGATRLGFGLLLKAFALQGRFPRHKHELPGAVIVHVARQVGVPAELYPPMSGPAARSSITVSRFGSSWASARRLFGTGTNSLRCFVAKVLPNEHREDHVREAVFDHCRALHIEPPSAGRVDRLTRPAFHIFEQRWCASVFEQLGAATQLVLDELLVTGSADDENRC